MGLTHRIGRLETRAQASSPAACPGCGYSPSAPVTVRIIPPEVRTRIDEASSADEQPGDRCAVCRRKQVFRIPSPRMERVSA